MFVPALAPVMWAINMGISAYTAIDTGNVAGFIGGIVGGAVFGAIYVLRKIFLDKLLEVNYN